MLADSVTKFYSRPLGSYFRISCYGHLADLFVVGDHPLAVVDLPLLASVLRCEMGSEVHRG